MMQKTSIYWLVLFKLIHSKWRQLKHLGIMTPVSKRFLDSLQADHWILTKGQRRGAEGKLREYQVTFNLKEASLGRTKLVEHCRYNEPRKSLPLQFNPYGVRAAVEEKQALLDQGQFKVNSLEWNAPIVLVKRMDNSP